MRLLAFIMLLHAKDPFVRSDTFMISPLGINFALNTLKSKDVLQCIILQNCLPSRARLNFYNSLNLTPPPSHALQLAQLFPPHPMDLRLIFFLTPPKTPYDSFNIFAQSDRELEVVHGVSWDNLYNYFNENLSTSLWEELFFPTFHLALYTFPNLWKTWQFFLTVKRWKSQILLILLDAGDP